MKFSFITQGRDGALHLTTRDEDYFAERITKDTQHGVVGELRERLGRGIGPNGFSRMPEVARVLPSVELHRQANGALAVRRYNGVVVLDVKAIAGADRIAYVKRKAMSQPSTMGVFVGCSGHSLKLLVRVSLPDGQLPEGDDEVARFHAEACRRLVPLYNVELSPIQVTGALTDPQQGFLMPLDSEPVFRFDASPYVVDSVPMQLPQSEPPTSELPDVPKADQQFDDEDYEGYKVYERLYGQAARKAQEEDEKGSIGPTTEYLHLLAHHLCQSGMPQEEALTHLINHYRYRRGFDQELARTIVESTYDDEHPAARQSPGSVGKPMRELIRRLEQRYAFRFNRVMGYTEYRRNTTYLYPWKPLTEREINGLVMEMRNDDTDVWDVDVKRFVNSSRIREYNPVEEFLLHLPKWDGRDHIRQLALTVPTPDSERWARWFHTWFLGMVAQWTGRTQGYGNAIVPLLVSKQGYRKSTFCRRILPPQLRQWGYTDNMNLAESRQVLLNMSQMLLINLDEFNAISPRLQEGFLKNIIQMPTVKVRRPYARHTEEAPRLASFIATTNMSDVLSDPSGSRRFIGVEITAPIDVSEEPNYGQLYAQALEELRQHVPSWFSDEDQEEVMQHNRRFHVSTDAMAYFGTYFALGSADDGNTRWLTAAEILTHLKQQLRGLLKAPSPQKFGRELRNIPGLLHKTSNRGEVYAVRLLGNLT